MKRLKLKHLKLLTLDQLVRRLGEEHQFDSQAFNTFKDADNKIQLIFYKGTMFGPILARISFGMTHDGRVFTLTSWGLDSLLPVDHLYRMFDFFEKRCPEVQMFRPDIPDTADVTLQKSDADPQYARFGFIFTLFLIQQVRKFRGKRRS